MADQALDEVKSRDRFFDIFVIFMAIIVEGYEITVITIDPGCCDHRTAKISADIFDDIFWITFVWFGINIKAVFMVAVDRSFHFFKGRAEFFVEFIEEGSLEGITQEPIVKVFDIPPEAIIGETAFRDKTMDVWIPFQIPAKGVQDTDEPGDEVSTHICFEEHTRDNTVDRRKQTVQQVAVL